MTIHQGRTALYRLYNAEGKLLYIGISQNPDVRWGQHSTTKPWWGDVEERKVEWHETRPLAAAAEVASIEAEQPLWNSNHATRPTGDPDADALYEDHRRNLEEARALLPAVREQAAADLKAGATVSQLAKLTGLTPEYFRRIARAEGVERLRPPTVGKLKPEGEPS
ncbi:GIY-YIG nuclease family protein [Streptomyces griseus]|uniref:GIY-YIG nuclease family protein n=1 Tax=Streptomyces griseus TaxID=1911 RepID=UPI00379C21D7